MMIDPSQQFKQFSALIADDEEPVRELLANILESTGLFKSIVKAVDGISASRRVFNQEFDVILLDINMPKLDGFEVIDRLLLQRKIDASNIIIISGGVYSEHVKKAIRMRVKNIITKPINKTVLKEKIEQILEKRKAAPPNPTEIP